MKKLLVLILTICFIFSLVGCGSKEKKKTENELYLKAVAVLDEYGNDNKVKDFRKAYDLLTTLSSDQDDFIKQLDTVFSIYKKYYIDNRDINHLLQKAKYGSKITKNEIENYKQHKASKDAENLMDLLVYPVIFNEHVDEVRRVKGLTFNKIKDIIKPNYKLDKSKKLKHYKKEETWKSYKFPTTYCKFKYHYNGLIEHISFPIVNSSNPLTEKELKAFANNTPDVRKQILSNRIPHLIKDIDLFSNNCLLLRYIYSEDEIRILNNYLTSLSVEDIFDNDSRFHKSLNTDAKPLHYFADVYLVYKGNNLRISYDLNNIKIYISGRNNINTITNKWATLECGLFYYDQPNVIDMYKDELNNDTTINNKIPIYAYNLDENANKFFPKANSAKPNNSKAITGVIVDTDYYTLTLPQSWKNESIYEIKKGKNHNYMLSFYDKKTLEINSKGFLCSLVLLPEYEDYTHISKYKLLGSIRVNDTRYHNLIITYPTDIQFTARNNADIHYFSMADTIPSILKTIKFKEGCVFLKNPNIKH